jgi:hypothetical protein
MRLRTIIKALTLSTLVLAVGVWVTSTDVPASWAKHLSKSVSKRIAKLITPSVQTSTAKHDPLPPPDTAKGFAKLVVRNLGKVVNSPDPDFCPTITADGRTMFFVSARPETSVGAQDFWVTTSAEGNDTVWSAPLDVTAINSKANDGAASIAADGQTIYFATNRPTTR